MPVQLNATAISCPFVSMFPSIFYAEKSRSWFLSVQIFCSFQVFFIQLSFDAGMIWMAFARARIPLVHVVDLAAFQKPRPLVVKTFSHSSAVSCNHGIMHLSVLVCGLETLPFLGRSLGAVSTVDPHIFCMFVRIGFLSYDLDLDLPWKKT